MKTVAYAFMLLVLFSCTADKEQMNLFNATNLSSFYITIDPAKDVVFNTPKGAAIKIRKGTFNEAVELEIKEVYTMKDILLAGLTTQSNGQPMTSGGMIYINTKDKRDIKPNQPISVAMPTSYVNEGMKLFKGEEQADGSINWVNPDTLPSTQYTNMIKEGRLLFQQNCQTCHSLDRNLTGPSLRGFADRQPWRNRQNVYNWIHNPASFMAKDDYTQNLKQRYGVIMQAFPELTNQSIDAMIAYVKNAQYNPNTNEGAVIRAKDSVSGVSRHYSADEEMLPVEKLCPDTTYYPKDTDLSDTIPFQPVDTTIFSVDTVPTISVDTVTLDVEYDLVPDGAYQFNINELGWYNIDALLKDIDNTVQCELKAQVKANGAIIPAQVYLFLPRHKVLHYGTPKKDGIYIFEASDGKMPLYLGAEAFILAIGNQKEQLYVGTASFHVKPSQQVTIELKPSSDEELLKTVKNGQLEGISLDIQKQKMAINYYPCDDAKPERVASQPSSMK